MKLVKKLIILISLLCLITGCEKKESVALDSEVELSVLSINCDKTEEEVNDGAILIDVRSEEEYKLSHLDQAINIPVDVIEEEIVNYVVDKGTPVILYCRSGNRSSNAAQTLLKLGYYKVYDLGAMDNCQI